MAITAGDSWQLTLAGGLGVGINATPSLGEEFVSGLGFFVTGGQTPVTGTGVSINYTGGAGNVTSENFGTSTLEPLNINSSLVNVVSTGGLQVNGVAVSAGSAIVTGATGNLPYYASPGTSLSPDASIAVSGATMTFGVAGTSGKGAAC